MESEHTLLSAISQITALDAGAMDAARKRQAELAKPPGSLGLLEDISVQLANMHVMINDINTRNFKDGRSTFSMTITVSGIEHLKSVAAKIERIDGVLSVERAAT